MKKFVSCLTIAILLIAAVPGVAFADIIKCDHSWSEWEIYDDYTCRDREAHRYCYECCEREIKIVPATTSHIWSDWDSYSGEYPCEPEYNYRMCEMCYIDEKVITVPGKQEHSWTEWELTDPPTCIEEGCRDRYCTVCGESEWDSVPSTGDHKWTDWYDVDEATCSKQGLRERFCENCNLLQKDSTQATGKHDWTEWRPYDNASCITGGQLYRWCAVCDIEEFKEFPITGVHNMSGWLVYSEASTEWFGYLINHCQDCSYYMDEIINQIKTIKLSKVSYVYDGKVKLPSVTVKDTEGKALVKGTDYTVNYKNAKGKVVVKPVNVGKYKAVIKFKGNYRGSVVKNFTIKPKTTAIKSLKAGDNSIILKWNKREPQVTGYQIRYSTSSKYVAGTTKYALIKSSKTVSKTIKQLKNNKKYYVQIRTYKTDNGAKVYSDWSKTKSVTTY